jgi:hypothetical protein
MVSTFYFIGQIKIRYIFQCIFNYEFILFLYNVSSKRE